MPPEPAADRHVPLAPVSAGAAFTTLPPAARFVLRGRAEAIQAAGARFGCPLPEQSCRAAVTGGGRAALWLGPDEWLLLAPMADGASLASALEQAMGTNPHSLVEVSHRQIAIEVSGPHALAILNAGCPLDLDPGAFPVGMCSRTVLAKSEIVLWRTAPETFHVEVARSFARYVWSFLEEASRWSAGDGPAGHEAEPQSSSSSRAAAWRRDDPSPLRD
ncbi:MAG: sarcosine oxidase subunit gamma [Acetobacteraceae bacterium]